MLFIPFFKNKFRNIVGFIFLELQIKDRDQTTAARGFGFVISDGQSEHASHDAR